MDLRPEEERVGYHHRKGSTGMASGTPYSESFYEVQKSGSVRSAEILVPHLVKLFRPASVLDVGCGTGTWLREFMRHGIDDVLGLDGGYVDPAMLAIPPEKFRATDLTCPSGVERRFDLACCLEVAEHLPESVARQLVDGLVAAAPVVVFSAAVPGQGGTNHVNEQWQYYWHSLFAAAGRATVDCVRPVFYDDDHVSWWYRQNILVYCDKQAVPEGFPVLASRYDINRILPEMTLGPRNGTQAVAAIRQSLLQLGYSARRQLKAKLRA
jgi:SAM-dependent methyltransferase